MVVAVVVAVEGRRGEGGCRQRPYHVENTGSRPITEVKLRWAGLVLAWVTGWEYPVLLAFLPSLSHHHVCAHCLLPACLPAVAEAAAAVEPPTSPILPKADR